MKFSSLCLLLTHFITLKPSNCFVCTTSRPTTALREWSGDFDGFVGDDGGLEFARLFDETKVEDRSGCRTRQFSLGEDIILSDFVGNMGFDEVTDWEYYYQGEDDPTERKVVQPNPFDKDKPKRTRASSGSVIRLFRGEFVGLIGGMISSQGLDRRVLVKEFTGKLALQLAQAELDSIGKLQSSIIPTDTDWGKASASRSTMKREDANNVLALLKNLQSQPFLGILGEVNLAELEGEMEPNEFYRALGVPPPKPDAIWIVYEYAGLSSLQAYCQPAQIRRDRMPIKKGFFGNPIPPPELPSWRERAKYVKAIMKQSTEALAVVHDNGLVHRSIGRSSLFLSCSKLDKREASSPYTTRINELRMKLADFGFSGNFEQSCQDEEFRTRARAFGLTFSKNENTIRTANFAIAEDLHALGFVFLGLLLTTLAELPDSTYPVPNTDEDTLQRLLTEIFEKDVQGQFREYVEAEEVWANVVDLLDENDSAGWKLLETLVLARERMVKNEDTLQMISIRGLLSNPFFD